MLWTNLASLLQHRQLIINSSSTHHEHHKLINSSSTHHQNSPYVQDHPGVFSLGSWRSVQLLCRQFIALWLLRGRSGTRALNAAPLVAPWPRPGSKLRLCLVLPGETAILGGSDWYTDMLYGKSFISTYPHSIYTPITR